MLAFRGYVVLIRGTDKQCTTCQNGSEKGDSGVRSGYVSSDPNREDAVFELFELMILSLDYGIEKLRTTRYSVELLMRMLEVG